MSYPLILAKPISYGGTRPLSSIKYIVIHYTACKGDTAKNECLCFKNVNQRYAGAHFFADQMGNVYQSVPINRVAWSVGGDVWFTEKEHGGARLYGKATNFNTVSIELCDLVDKAPSDKMVKAVRKLVKYLKKKCPNADTVIRHWDVTGKPCPLTMKGKNNAAWKKFHAEITGSVPYKVKVTADVLNVRGGAGAKYKKKGELKKGEVYTIVKENKKKTWGKLKSGLGWIALEYTKKV